MIKGIFPRSTNTSINTNYNHNVINCGKKPLGNHENLPKSPVQKTYKNAVEYNKECNKPMPIINNNTKKVQHEENIVGKILDDIVKKPKNRKLEPIVSPQDPLIDSNKKNHMMKYGLNKENTTINNQYIEPIEIETESTIDLDILYDMDYGNDMENYIFNSQPDFSFSLKNTDIKENLRAKMVDWMVEVLGNYFATCSHQTFFLSVNVMDLYFKYSKRRLKDSDVHLSGIACMFIASKFDDVYHIPLKDFVERVSHNKYTHEDIKIREWEILSTLNFNVNVNTHLDYLNRLIYKNFQDDASNILKQIKDTSIYILKMCLHDYKFLNFKPKLLSLSVLCYSIKCYFFALTQENKQTANINDLANHELFLLQGILDSCGEYNMAEVDKCVIWIRDLTLEFESKYSDLCNLKKFNDKLTR